jgi:DNA invertase Pin-like site-specific DNA recombinase
MLITLDAYIRISRVGARKEQGDSYISPSVQREAIESWAKANGVTVGKVVKEEDVSGGKAVKDRALEELVKRAEAGASSGIIVYRLNRFARSQSETHLAAYRIKEAGARLVAVADGYDSESPGGAYVLAFMAVEAEKYLTDVKQNWAAATDRAADRGWHVACRAPAGYLRKDEDDPERNERGEIVKDASLVLDKTAAKHVRRAFELRAEGQSYRQIAAFLTEAGVRPGNAGPTWLQWSAMGVRGLLSNRQYLGHLYRKDKLVKKDAHEAIVSAELFAVVQATMDKAKFHGRNGKLSEQALLVGLVTCAGCGHNLRVTGSTNGGKREASYTCAKHFSTGNCPAPAAMRVARVDGYLMFLLQQPEVLDAIATSGASAETRWLEARTVVEDAEAELDHWVETPGMRVTLGDTKFERGITVRAEALDAARRALWALDDPGLPEGTKVVHIGGQPIIYDLWNELPIEQRRQQLRRSVASISVAQADPKRRRWQPIEERLAVRWVA